MSQWSSDIQTLAQTSWTGAPGSFATPGAQSVVTGGESGYDGVVSRGRRRPPKVQTKHEDFALRAHDRQKLIATTQDLQRNFTAAAWMIRRHLDYVASFRFKCTTGDDRIDDQVERLIADATTKENFDVSGRFRMRRFVRMLEARRCVDGDVAAMMLKTGHLQAIEGDHIRKPAGLAEGMPDGLKLEDFVNGVRTDDTGRITQYMICDRDRKGGAYQFRQVLPAHHVIFHANVERFDQTRGISPIAAALNTFCDAYEGIEYTLAKMKLEQLFGLKITTSDEDGVGNHTPVSDPTATGEGDEEGEESGNRSVYDVDFGRGLYKLELEPGDDAQIMQGTTPSIQFQTFLSSMIAMALKSLDIPYSFYDESFTNFYGSRGGLMQYLKSCNTKREDIAEVLDTWLSWRLSMMLVNGTLKLPAGVTLAHVLRGCQWIPDGTPWWDPSKEVDAAGKAVAGNFTTFEKVVRETNGGTGDIFQNIRDNAKVRDYARKMGYPIILPGATALMAEPVDPEDEAQRHESGNKKQNDKEDSE